MSDKHEQPKAAAAEPATQTVTFSQQYLSYYPGDKAAFSADEAKALQAAGVVGGKPPEGPVLFRMDLPPNASPSPKDYDPQHRALDPNRAGNFPTRQHNGPPARSDAPPAGKAAPHG